MIGKLKCWWKGHKRGKRDTDKPVIDGHIPFRCPRCKATWTRKAKA